MAVDERELIGEEDEPDIRIDTDLQDSPPILGVIQLDHWTKGRDGQKQWQIGVKPYNVQMRSEDGLISTWANVSTQNRSKMGHMLKAFRIFGMKNPATGEAYRIGKGQYVGKEAWFKRDELKFGRDKQTGEVIKTEVLVPFKLATQEEIETALAQLPSQVSADGVETRSAPAKMDLSDDDVETLMALFVGKSVKDAQFAAPKAGLTPELKQAVMSGKVWKVLTERGIAGTDADGKVIRV